MVNHISGNTIAEIASLIGDVSRANILLALMDGRALTAGELSYAAGVSAQTTSGHLAKLLDCHLICLEKQQGRHRYYRLASPEIAHLMEVVAGVAAVGPVRYRPTGPKDAAMRLARSCYDHIAGRLGIEIAASLCSNDYVVLWEGADAGLGTVSEAGQRFLCEFGVDLSYTTHPRRSVCRTCLDWSERRPHLAGQVGAAILNRSLELGWLLRQADSRALQITETGKAGFQQWFGCDLTETISVAYPPQIRSPCLKL